MQNNNNQRSMEVSRSFARMLARYRKKKSENIQPHCCCARCGAQMWEQEEDYLWYCFKCGNRGYWQDRRFLQGGENYAAGC